MAGGATIPSYEIAQNYITCVVKFGESVWTLIKPTCIADIWTGHDSEG